MAHRSPPVETCDTWQLLIAGIVRARGSPAQTAQRIEDELIKA